MALALVVLVALHRPPAPPSPWLVADRAGFSVSMPVAPTAQVVDGGRAGAETAVVRDRAYSVVWFVVDPSAAGHAVISAALGRLAKGPATVVSSRDLTVGPFAAADLTARVGGDYLHGRLVVVGDRAYLVGEVTPTLIRPSDLDRLLVSFDPHLSAP